MVLIFGHFRLVAQLLLAMLGLLESGELIGIYVNLLIPLLLEMLQSILHLTLLL